MIDARQTGELEFAPIRGELARAFLAHKADMGLGDASDEWILGHVDDVAVVLIALTEHAMKIDDRAWLRRVVWWRALAYALRAEARFLSGCRHSRTRRACPCWHSVALTNVAACAI